jgi:succinylglutamic semialdehyde dehydrogenase
VSVILGSYVWPIFYSAQFLFANFLVGNSVILKPAEKATLTVWRLVEILRALEPFSGTQLVVGDREVGRRLAIHEAVSTVIFQGSFEVGMRVKQDCLSQPAKEVLLYLGSKNASIVFADANALAVDRLIEDCFQGAGQNCRSISVIFVERSKLPEFCEKFHEKSKAFKIGNPNADAWMGPLVEGAICDRYLKFIGISEREGAELLMRGKLLPQAGRGYFVTPTLAVFKEITSDKFRKSVSLQTEVLSPHVSIIGFETEDALLALVDQMTYGRLATIWTEDSERSKRIAARLSVGEIAINQGALQMHPWDTTQARKRSGNHAYLGRGLLSQLVYQKQVYGE